MKYFSACTTLEEVKKLYKVLALQHHPDRGGDTATMQEINKEYAFACAFISKNEGKTDAQVDQELKISEEYRQRIEKIIHLPGILIEVVGNWIWVTGDTRTVKDELKAAGYFFAGQKKAWYYRNEAFKSFGKGGSLDQIRAKYGTQSVATDRRRQLDKE
ncbi:hypothetical protein [Paraflavitalea sp. CAU 1676]|uniref:hypothetical protein n=1 Tax=Paraflavitalea sp. CAU 1676 TaxID=3032598 RepID=UPI0023DBD220|nr:hypothetical protein [Paraflavitalea sp. CAU 1676]MDF2188686.1 hypothetical protein [Paraflavitalea sp. CAU 1676]